MLPFHDSGCSLVYVLQEGDVLFTLLPLIVVLHLAHTTRHKTFPLSGLFVRFTQGGEGTGTRAQKKDACIRKRSSNFFIHQSSTTPTAPQCSTGPELGLPEQHAQLSDGRRDTSPQAACWGERHKCLFRFLDAGKKGWMDRDGDRFCLQRGSSKQEGTSVPTVHSV